MDAVSAEEAPSVAALSHEGAPRPPGGKPFSALGGAARRPPGSRHRTDSSASAGSSTHDVAGVARRSSTRSIKRKKFDDEIVESGLSLPSMPAQKPRTLSAEWPAVGGGGAGAGSVVVGGAPAPLSEPLRRRPGRATARRSRRGRAAAAAALKDVGRWKPTDDLALIGAVQQVCDLTLVHLGIKFSCKFTLSEIQERWYALLYDPAVSKAATQAMRGLHPEQVAEVERRALYSQAEEDLLKEVKSTSAASEPVFQALLDAHPETFQRGRSAGRLQQHWQQLKLYQLLNDQAAKPASLQQDSPPHFSDAEEALDDLALLEKPPDEQLNRELQLADRRDKQEVARLETDTRRWQVLVDAVTGVSPPEFDNGTLAILRGRTVRYLMRSGEVTLGRNSADGSVDIDLSLEGPAWKVSRRQGVIKLRSCGQFQLANVGRRAVFVDGRPVLAGAKHRLNDNSTVQISHLRFTFVIHHELVNAVRQKYAQTGAAAT